ncbi:undecaprenyl-phosphate glucose phosphotransferase [Methyloligella solikamskensis]|uniref:Undecaprenyl-phosphate glucose phosphotransferase n=1 Tax=Methyloligella solikamskensis TaxID=1177756 RepID=A0ABW3JC21_9HYPH
MEPERRLDDKKGRRPRSLHAGPPKGMPERRKHPRPPLAEIRRAASLSLLPNAVLVGATRVVEFLIIAGLGFAIYLLHVAQEPGQHIVYLGAVVTGALVFCGLAQGFGLYSIKSFREFTSSYSRIVLAWTLVLAAFMAVAFFAKVGAEFSRVWLGSWYVSVLSLLLAERLSLLILMRRWLREGRLYRRAVIIGGGEQAEELIRSLEASPNTDIRIAGIFDDRGDDRVLPLVAGYPKLGKIKDLVDFARKSRVDLLIISLPMAAEKRVLQILKTLWVLPVDIRLSAQNNALRFRPHTYSYIGNVPFIDIADKPIADWDFVQKRVFDAVLAGAGLLVLSPLMLLIALAIKLTSKGPVFFKQTRQGFNNELIDVYKFRSMYTDMTDAEADRLVTKGDPRVTPIGRLLRKTSLDELPQLFNVLKGDLSLVGPRPHALKAKAKDRLYADVVDGYFARHRVKPGVTGWAQIHGWRGETDTEEKIRRRVEHDLYYIENWSVVLDLYILLMTPIALLKMDNAY